MFRFVFVAIFLFSFVVHSEVSPLDTTSEIDLSEFEDTTEFANIQKGNVQVSGGFGAGYSQYSSSIQINPSAEYFIIDRLSIGGTLEASFFSSTSIFGIGPSISYYFWQNEKWTSYLGIGAFYTQRTYQALDYDVYYPVSDFQWSGFAKLGLQYFITPSVAFGPYLKYTSSYTSNINILMQFGVFL